MNAFVSVCITTFNRSEILPTTIESVQNQSYKNIEIIIVDDFSTDYTESVVAVYIEKDSRIKYIKHKENRGLAAARNTALLNAKGEFFTFCDDDDSWPETFIEKMLLDIEKEPENVGMVIGYSENYNAYFHSTFNKSASLKELMIKGYTPPVGSQFYKMQMLKEVGGYNEVIKSGVDHDLWISLSSLNPRVAISWGNTAIMNDDLKMVRITLKEKARREKINDSLKIWRPKLTAYYGIDFYNHFCFSYQQHFDYKFFKIDIINKKYLKALRRFKNLNLLTILLNRLINKITNKKGLPLFPAYKFSNIILQANRH